jgi:hypothetical protein
MTAPSRMKTTPCRACPTLVRNDSRSGFCGKCVKQTPEFKARASQAARNRTPEHRAKLGAAQRRACQADPTIRQRKSIKMRALAATPEWRARNAESCTQRRLWEQGLAARTAETLARQGVTFTRRHGHAIWCPEDYLNLARKLRRAKLPLLEVMRLVWEQHDKDMAEFRLRCTQPSGKVWG